MLSAVQNIACALLLHIYICAIEHIGKKVGHRSPFKRTAMASTLVCYEKFERMKLHSFGVVLLK